MQNRLRLALMMLGAATVLAQTVIRDLQQGSDATFCDDTIGALRAMSGNEPCEKETQLELETGRAVSLPSAA